MNQKEFEQRYRIEKNIGSGGFSEVFQAKERKTGRYVAIKKSQVKEEWKGFELMREYELANRLPHHDNIARYNACYRYDTGMGGVFDFAVLNYYEYGNLEQFLKRNSLNEEQTEQMVRGILEGLTFLHRRDIIHRDFKAQNILIDREHGVWIPKITDFGLSRAALAEDSVHNSAIAMSYAYAAPEQLKGEKISRKVDIWSMGVLMYRIVAGELPFQVETVTDNRSAANAELTRQILSGKLPEKLKNLRQPYRSMIGRCLVHDTQLRLGDVEKLLSMLDSIRVGSGSSDSAPKPVAEKEDQTLKIDPNTEDPTEVIETNAPTIPLLEKDNHGSETDPLPRDPMLRPHRFQKQNSAYLELLSKLGLHLGNKPAQRTLWYWTYIPIGVFVTSWLAFFINGGLEPKPQKEEPQKEVTLPKIALTPKLDTLVAPPKPEIKQIPTAVAPTFTESQVQAMVDKAAKKAAAETIMGIKKKDEMKETVINYQPPPIVPQQSAPVTIVPKDTAKVPKGMIPE
jgi:serine/threonine protein kinase